MAVADEIRSYLGSLGASVGGKGQSGDAKLVIAEQKSFLSKKKVEYSAKFKVQDEDRPADDPGSDGQVGPRVEP